MQELTIYLEDGRTIQELRRRLVEVETEKIRLEERVRDLEFKYRCESVVNMELLDLCRAHGVRYRPGLAARPWEEASSSIETDKAGASAASDHATARATAPSPEGKEPG